MSINRNTLSHDSAKGHVSGESLFIDDRLKQRGELWVEYFSVKIAHAKILSVDTKKAQEVEGIVGIYTHEDFHHNLWGAVISDQPLLASTQVLHAGEPIVLVAGETKEAVAKAKKLIKVEVEELPAVLTIKEARKKELFYSTPVKQLLESGNIDEAFKKAPHHIKGSFYNGGQEHFYLESQATIVYPLEHGCLEVHSSSQHPTEVQHVVAHALGLQMHEVVTIVKRMGGGFGGKESQASHFAALAALVAQKTKRPARIVLTKDDDMLVTGKRHPFMSDYEVAFDQDGKILGLKVDFFSDGGAYYDLSLAILNRAMFHVDNAYYLENARITGKICRTNLASNTAFRGFGAPQGVIVIENAIEEMAKILNKDPLEIRRLNCYGDEKDGRNVTPYGQTVVNNMLPAIYDKLIASSNYEERLKEIKAFNASSKTHLRGISLVPVKFGISFTAKFLNQGSSLLNINSDGTAQVSTGATEMGQGVNVKMLGIVASTFSLDPKLIRVMPTSTEKNHNTSATAASSGADINGSATLKACLVIKNRLALFALGLWDKAPEDKLDVEINEKEEGALEKVEFLNGMVFDKRNPDKRKISFKELVNKAYFHRINLGTLAHYKTPEIHFDMSVGKGRPFLYHTNGASVSEVLIDRFTGEVKVTRADLLMDLGRSLNEGIDEGQMAGAYVQGMGWATTEELYYEKGVLLSHSPTTYKIPSIQDTPRIFNIDLIENHENKVNVLGSKAVGEPPFVLGLSVWTAIKQVVDLKHLPATPEIILKGLKQGQRP